MTYTSEQITALITQTHASIEKAADAATPLQGERIRSGESDDERLRLLVELGEALKAEHQRAERMTVHAVKMAQLTQEARAERDALRAVLDDIRAEQQDYTIPHDEALSNIGEILSRAIDTKETK